MEAAKPQLQDNLRHWHIIKPYLLGYGVVIFAAHPAPSFLVLLATFYHPMVGVMGLAGNILANITARWMGANEEIQASGIYGVNGLLVGLALGMHGEPSLKMLLFLLVGSVVAGIVSVFLGNKFLKNDLPILSLPFMMLIWPLLILVGITSQDRSAFAIIPVLRSSDQWLYNNVSIEVFQYIKMFGNILFQENLISGVLVYIALALYSRVSLAYAMLGGVLGILTHLLLYGTLSNFNGLNYILIALAFGGFFIISNRHGFLYAVIAIFSVGLLDYAIVKFLKMTINPRLEVLPTLVWSFNIVTLVFLYPLKKIALARADLNLIPVPLSVVKSPEANQNWLKRWQSQRFRQKTVLSLPFTGSWTVLQGNDGEWTHKDKGRYAWDFVVTDSSGSQHSGYGLSLTDFHAFGLPVFAPASGTVVAVENAILDNPPRTANTENNWGNYIVLDHGNGEYTELSHFKQGSIVIYLGQVVNRGQLLGYCGNSGRSAVPHIHMQLQEGPKPGDKSIPARIAEATINGSLKVNCIPQKDDTLSPPEIDTEHEWTLLGKEGESWIADVKLGMVSFRETLTFGSDYFGAPAMLGKNHFLWTIQDRPNFFEIIPDYKTFPTLLAPSGWMKIVGESLVLPKKLKVGLKWEVAQFDSKGRKKMIQGHVISRSSNLWLIEVNNLQITIDETLERIIRVMVEGDEHFRFVVREPQKDDVFYV